MVVFEEGRSKYIVRATVDIEVMARDPDTAVYDAIETLDQEASFIYGEVLSVRLADD